MELLGMTRNRCGDKVRVGDEEKVVWKIFKKLSF